MEGQCRHSEEAMEELWKDSEEAVEGQWKGQGTAVERSRKGSERTAAGQVEARGGTVVIC